MSDTIPTTDTTPTSPEPAASTAEIIETAIADLPDESGDAPDADDSHDAPLTTGGDATAAPTAAEIDELAQILGISGEGKAKWTARIPYSKVHKAWKDLQAKTRADHDAALQQRDARLREVEAVERLIVEQPEQFLRALVEQNPAYRQYLGAGTPGMPLHDPSGQMPAPDIRLADGTQTYSVEGLRRLLDWNAQQAEQRVAQRLQPIERERQQREILESAIPRVKQQLAEAQSWPLFNESKAEILAVLQGNPNVDLTGAYQRVVIPKLAASRDRLRQDVLREIGQRPHSTSVTRTTGGRADEHGPRDSRDVILQAIAELD